VVEKALAIQLDESTVSADARAILRQGEFFYDYDQTSTDGFFLTGAPRNSHYEITIVAEGYRNQNLGLDVGNYMSVQVAPYLLYR
jgi:hypothetical protein